MPIKSRLRVLIAEKETRERKRISIRDLARETGLAESTLHSFANNTTQRFDAPILERLCIYFDVPLSELLVFYPEGEISTMDNSSLQTEESAQDGALGDLKAYYLDTINEMRHEFTSHEFILRLAERHQREYIEALYAYKESSAPFQALHAQVSKALYGFPEQVEIIAQEAPSKNIWGNHSKCAKWRRR